MVLLLGQEIDAVFAQQHQVGAAIAIEVTGAKPVDRELAVINGPAFGGAPTVGALVVEHNKLSGVAVVGEVRPAVAIQIGDRQAGDALFRGDGFHAEPGIGRQLVQLAFAFGPGLLGQVGLAGLVIEQVDPRVGIVHHDDVVQTVAIEVRHAQLAHLAVDWKFLGPRETKAAGVGVVRQAGRHQTRARSPDNAPAHLLSEPSNSLQASRKLPMEKAVGKHKADCVSGRGRLFTDKMGSDGAGVR